MVPDAHLPPALTNAIRITGRQPNPQRIHERHCEHLDAPPHGHRVHRSFASRLPAAIDEPQVCDWYPAWICAGRQSIPGC